MITTARLTTLDVARILGRTRVRVWQLIKRRKLKAKRFGRQWEVLPEHLREYLETKLA